MLAPVVRLDLSGSIPTQKDMLLVDLDKCLGCYASEVSCQQWYIESA